MYLNEKISFIVNYQDRLLPRFSNLKAQQRNKELNKKYQYIEQERNKLNALVNLNQVEVITGKNNLNSLLNELKTRKQLNMNVVHRLEIYNEQIDLIQSCIEQINNLKDNSVTDLKPIKEKLSFKWDVEQCLQTMLVEIRLQAAEKEAIIIELKLRKGELENEMKVLKDDSNASNVSQWQEEFLSTKIQEADIILEFDKLKRLLASIKHELEEKQMETNDEDNREDKDYLQINFNLKDRFQEKIRMEENNSIARTVKLQDEIDHLKIQVKKLEDIKEDLNSRIYFNEEVKIHLYEVRTSIFHRLQTTKQELDRIIEKYKTLEAKLKNELAGIQNNIDSKDTVILQLAEETKTLQLQNENSVISNNQCMISMNENAVSKLEEKIKNLEEEMVALSREDDK